MRIYALHGTRPTLAPTGGDVINEARFLSSLTAFAEVFYNGQQIVPGAPNLGLTASEIQIPPPGFDLYYIRGNHPLFLDAPHPKVTMAYPYDAEIYRQADALFVTTQTWKEMLERFSPQFPPKSWRAHWYGDAIVPPKRVINIGQVGDPDFTPKHGHPKTFTFRARFTHGFVVGYFGRIDEKSLPDAYLEALPELERRIPKLQTVFAGNIRVPLPPRVRIIKRIDVKDMPYATSACDAVIYDCDDTGHWLGSGKVIDAMMAGVPILARKHRARIEQLGEDYPLFFENSADIIAGLERLARDRPFREQLAVQMRERSARFSPAQAAARLEPELRALL